MRSKENNVLGLFFNYPSKQWHFEEILKESKITRSKADRWLKQFAGDKVITKTKKRGRMPYYSGNHLSPEYQNRKRLYALEQLHESGFLNHLISLKKAETVIIFGSITRWDWHKESDIDLFIYGDAGNLDINKYSSRLGREIQVFSCKTRKDFEKLGTKLMKSILLGDIIKGEADFIEVEYAWRQKLTKRMAVRLKPK